MTAAELDLAAIRARADAAALGPWGLVYMESQHSQLGDEYIITTERTSDTVATLIDESHSPGYEEPHWTLDADAPFIVAARADVVTLLDLVDELQARLTAAGL